MGSLSITRNILRLRKPSLVGWRRRFSHLVWMAENSVKWKSWTFQAVNWGILRTCSIIVPVHSSESSIYQTTKWARWEDLGICPICRYSSSEIIALKLCFASLARRTAILKEACLECQVSNSWMSQAINCSIYTGSSTVHWRSSRFCMLPTTRSSRLSTLRS